MTLQQSLWNDRIQEPKAIKNTKTIGKTRKKINQKKKRNKFNARDHCQTPPYGVVPILPYIPEGAVIWEPAVAEGFLAEALRKKGYKVITSGQQENFFKWEPAEDWDIIVTNPPWSIAIWWIKRCLEFGKPFNLLLKTELIGTVGWVDIDDDYPMELIQSVPRIDYKMPNTNWDGKGSDFPSMWYTYGMNVGERLTTVRIGKEKKAFKDWIKAGGDPMQFCLF